jgi:protein-disulfide isomerase
MVRRLIRPAALGLAAALLLPGAARPAADTESVTDLAKVKEVDFGGLSEAQKKSALKLMNEKGCNCGCSMTIARCRERDTSCRRSLIFARTIVDTLREGKGEAETAKALDQKTATFVEAKLPDDTGTVYAIDTSHNPVRGPKDAPVTVVEFSDFQCPFCAGLQSTLDQVRKAFPKDVRLIYKQYPLNIHPYARQAALASLAAYAQGKFWEMHDKMFQNFKDINDENLRKWAREVGLNVGEFQNAIESGKHDAMVQKDMTDGANAKVLGTPTVFVNGKRLSDKSFEGFKKAIQDELAARHGAPSPASTKKAASSTAGAAR